MSFQPFVARQLDSFEPRSPRAFGRAFNLSPLVRGDDGDHGEAPADLDASLDDPTDAADMGTVELPELDEPDPAAVAAVAAAVAAAEERGAARALAEAEVANEEERARLESAIDATLAMREEWQHCVRASVAQILEVTLDLLIGSEALAHAALTSRIAELTETLVGQQSVVLSVHPDLVELAKETLGDRTGWEVRADDALEAGGCCAVCGACNVDATLTAVRDAIKEHLADWSGKREDAA